MERMTVMEFCEALSSNSPVPGGGGASALAGALGAALARMAASLTVDKKRYEQHKPLIQAEMDKLQAWMRELLMSIQKDADAFLPLRDAYALPLKTEAERGLRNAGIQAALATAVMPPLEIMMCCEAVATSLPKLLPVTSPLVISDIGSAAAMCRACLGAGLLNVLVNIRAMEDRTLAQVLASQAASCYDNGMNAATKAFDAVREQLCKR
jgi:formiminotetrahydrofolate cyclodeaminase